MRLGIGPIAARFRKNGPPPFVDPSSLAGLGLWLKADSIAQADNTTVSTWNDSSGNGRNVSVAAGLTAATFRTSAGPGGKPSLSFGNNQGYRLNSTALMTTDITVFVVHTYAGPATGGAYCPFSCLDELSTPKAGFRHEVASGIMYSLVYKIGVAGNNQTTLGSYVINWPYLFRMRSSGNAVQTWISNSNPTLRMNTSDAGWQPATNRSGLICIGFDSASGNISPQYVHLGYISEVIWYTRALNDTDMGKVNTYIQNKYGVQGI